MKSSTGYDDKNFLNVSKIKLNFKLLFLLGKDLLHCNEKVSSWSQSRLKFAKIIFHTFYSNCVMTVPYKNVQEHNEVFVIYDKNQVLAQ